MDYYSSHISKLIEEFAKLPGIGAKSAGRLAFHVINMPLEQAKSLADAIVDAKSNVRYCKNCQTLTDRDYCPICESTKRNHKVIMVVEQTRDMAAYERTGKFDGVYHVLHRSCRCILGGRADQRGRAGGLPQSVRERGRHAAQRLCGHLLPRYAQRPDAGLYALDVFAGGARPRSAPGDPVLGR